MFLDRSKIFTSDLCRISKEWSYEVWFLLVFLVSEKIFERNNIKKFGKNVDCNNSNMAYQIKIKNVTRCRSHHAKPVYPHQNSAKHNGDIGEKQKTSVWPLCSIVVTTPMFLKGSKIPTQFYVEYSKKNFHTKFYRRGALKKLMMDSDNHGHQVEAKAHMAFLQVSSNWERAWIMKL